MILLWLALTTLIQSSITLIPSAQFPGAAWLQLAIIAACAAALMRLTLTLRSKPAFGLHGQWLILGATIALLLTQGGRPGHAGDIARAIGLDSATQMLLTQVAQMLLIAGIWQALSNLARSKAQHVRALEAELHNAMTEMVIEPIERPRATPGPRQTQTGLTSELTNALELIGPAHRALRDLVLREPNNIAARLALHNRLRDDNTEKPALLLHAADFIKALQNAKRIDVALSIAEECARQDTQYYPDPEASLVLAHFAIREGKNASALRLLKHFDVRHPDHPAIPEAFFLSARALGGIGRNTTAQALLGALVSRFPDNALAADAIALSARLAVRR